MIYSKEQLSFKNEKLCIILGGVAGIGKTTLALSAPKPLLIDLDNGIKRVAPRFRKDTDIVSSYEELINDLNGDLSLLEVMTNTTGKEDKMQLLLTQIKGLYYQIRLHPL